MHRPALRRRASAMPRGWPSFLFSSRALNVFRLSSGGASRLASASPMGAPSQLTSCSEMPLAHQIVQWGSLPCCSLYSYYLRTLSVTGLYSDSSASIAINGFHAPPFPQTRGVRQSCPLAPKLFVCALECLPMASCTQP